MQVTRLSLSMPAADLARHTLLPLLPPLLLLLPSLLLLAVGRLSWLHVASLASSHRVVADRMRLRTASTDSITAGAWDNHKHHIWELITGPLLLLLPLLM
jgi:hypothetical protein